MIIAVASGKGGTGKTTCAVALAEALPGPVQLLDCDVEEPNCHIFAKPLIEVTVQVSVPVPQVDAELCQACGACGRACNYNAIVTLPAGPLIFAELCHGCGGCVLACPHGALTEGPRDIGVVEIGTALGMSYVQGRLNIGQALSPPVIRGVKKHILPGATAIIDCPPGTACPMVTAVRGADFVILVTEPTPFGLHDLTLAAATIRELGLPAGVIINRCDSGDDRVRDYCHGTGLPLLMEIPEDRRIAEAYSRGETLLNARPDLRTELAGIGRRITAVRHHFAEARR